MIKKTILAAIFLWLPLWAFAQSEDTGLDLDDAEAYVRRGDEYYKSADYDRAIADYTEAINLDQNYTGAYHNRGVAYEKKSDIDNSIADYTQAIDLQPNHTVSYYGRGIGYINKGDYDRAIADFDRVIELEPNNAFAYNGRGVAYERKGSIDRAIADYTRALNIDANYTIAYTNREAAYAKGGINTDSVPAAAGIPPERILSTGSMTRDELVRFLLTHNPALEKRRDWVNTLIDRYIAEAGGEGVNYEIAFAQMCYHTNYLKFEKTLAKAETNNFCGINSLTSSNKAHAFESVPIGVRAHIQHLKGYAATEGLNGTCVDPRYQSIGKTFGFGSAPTINDLSSKWAGAGYAGEIRRILRAMYGG
ncbi:hypothetical protein AGMMS49942_15190 [Spirochaetia bacterium]|nr:hypothetical protein AGMMS49942_15190 [Spirochaetia bacterium]